MGEKHADAKSVQAQNISESEVVPEEYIITTHRILENFKDGQPGVDLLHSDLFDSREKIVLSALSALGRLKSRSSIRYISRLFANKDENIQCVAVRTIGEIGETESSRLLLDLFKTTQSERLRSEILSTLAELVPKDPEVIALIRAYSNSPIVHAEARALATAYLLKIDDRVNIGHLLSEASSDNTILTQIFLAAKENPKQAEAVINHAPNIFRLLSIENKSLLISLASPFSLPKAQETFFGSLKDINPEIRRACYRVIGKDEAQIGVFGSIVGFLLERVESSPELEEEVHLAIGRMEECLNRKGTRLLSQIKEDVFAHIVELYEQIKRPGRRVVSDTHELGWLIVRSKEYLEYYGDEDLKHCVVQYLKGIGSYTMEEILQHIKRSAVRVEVRHFEGYNALRDLIKDPKRSGIALVARELALAKVGKKMLMYRLIRALLLSRLFTLTGKKELIYTIYSWAKEAKLYRLSEAALFALAKIDRNVATTACRGCMTHPIESKILAIASIRLLKDMNWTDMGPSVTNLLANARDPYILLNLIDALSALTFPIGGELIKTVLDRLMIENDQEILSRLGSLIGEKADINILDELMGIYSRAMDWKKLFILSIISRLVAKQHVSADVGLSEFLYKLLRSGSSKTKVQAATLLYRTGDDYSLEVLKDLIANIGLEEKIEMVRGLSGVIKADLVTILGLLLHEEDGSLQEALRETLLSVEEREIQEAVIRLILKGRGRTLSEEEGGYTAEESELRIDFSKEKKAYRFEREHIDRCAVFFTDIQGYSKKTQALTSMELATLIHEYEGILFPIISSHYGELIKRMGDGHLFVFRSPLNAVLCGIRLQKAIKRFDSFREEKYRIIVRCGIHYGEVVREGDDVFGNTVNIASRLESTAEGGSVYISNELNEEVKKYIHSREIGLIQVKGIEAPIRMFEPYEIAVGLSKELDPVKTREGRIEPGGEDEERIPFKGATTAHDKDHETNSLSKKMAAYFKQTVSTLNTLCIKVEKGEAETSDLRKELFRRWKLFQSLMNNY